MTESINSLMGCDISSSQRAGTNIDSEIGRAACGESIMVTQTAEQVLNITVPGNWSQTAVWQTSGNQSIRFWCMCANTSSQTQTCCSPVVTPPVTDQKDGYGDASERTEWDGSGWLAVVAAEEGTARQNFLLNTSAEVSAPSAVRVSVL